MGVAPLALAACDVPNDPPAQAAQSAQSPQIVSHQFKSVTECTAAGNPQDQCQKAFDNAQQFAVQSAPHFTSQDQCVAQYGADRCQQHTDNSGNSFWGPMMEGFLLAQMLDAGRPTYIVSQPLYLRTSGGYYQPYSSGSGWSSSGYVSSGSYSSGRSSSFTSSTAGTSVASVSRGGFGSAAAARGGWGGGGSSSFGG
jgi:uncharacterized protein YgiB involved in biofilm formation